MVFGDRLRRLREQQGLTQDALGHAADMHPRMIQKYELGLSTPSVDKAARLAEVLHTTVDYLVGLTNNEAQALTEEALTPEEQELIFALRARQTARALRTLSRIAGDEIH